jgi:hypothetical protein
MAGVVKTNTIRSWGQIIVFRGLQTDHLPHLAESFLQISHNQLTIRAEAVAPTLTDGLRLFFNYGDVKYVSVKGGETVTLPVSVKYPWLVDISPDRTEGLVCANTTSQAACQLWAVPLLGGSARRLGNRLVQLQGSAWSP